MGSKGINISSVFICALMVLGLILEEVQLVEAKTPKSLSCCRSIRERNCYSACHLSMRARACANACGCILVTGITNRSQCPDGYKRLTFIPDDIDESDSNEVCRLGCRSSVCNYMTNNEVGVEGMEAIVERCGEGCDLFCNGDTNIASVVA